MPYKLLQHTPPQNSPHSTTNRIECIRGWHILKFLLTKKTEEYFCFTYKVRDEQTRAGRAALPTSLHDFQLRAQNDCFRPHHHDRASARGKGKEQEERGRPVLLEVLPGGWQASLLFISNWPELSPGQD